ncbi:disease resistance protein RGA2-like [Pistacia vera]|uniref:disease resistance protein RGA2-like n=1 Tax=Pistacia vera TaxID=55513 RepID=UPI001263A513|nr:disease resistance protein RGA2-like [Pistacia vera]
MGGAYGSKIVVTTRSNQVASVMGTVPPYILNGLPHKDCMSLFFKWAFVDGEEKKYPNLIKFGGEIVETSGGIPLAVRTLGSLLCTKTDESDWLFIKDNDIWRLEQREDDILPALKLSYDRLPSQLQRCFSYCSLFPKDYHFDSRYLVHFWMALGLVIPYGNEELEDAGLRYLKEFLSRCFFQDVEDFGFYFTFKMHDLVHDLAVSVAERECLVVKSETQNVDRRVRHFSFVDTHFYKDESPKLSSNTDSVRTIFFPREDYGFLTESFLKMCFSKYLRLLSLSSILHFALPDSIGTLKHLRYLDLSDNIFLTELPESICKLHSLQTLRLLGCSLLHGLPSNIKYMSSLRYLELTTAARDIPENGIECLKSLRYLCMDNCLNLLSLFDVQSLTALRTLCIQECGCLISLPCSMKKLTRLEKLVIQDCPKLNLKMELQEEDTYLNLQTFMLIDLPALEYLPQLILQGSATTLQYMRIEKCPSLKALPEWFQNLTSLQKLEIISCRRLSSLPEGIQYLAALREKKIQDSPALSERCRQDCLMTAHVSEIILD